MPCAPVITFVPGAGSYKTLHMPLDRRILLHRARCDCWGVNVIAGRKCDCRCVRPSRLKWVKFASFQPSTQPHSNSRFPATNGKLFIVYGIATAISVSVVTRVETRYAPRQHAPETLCPETLYPTPRHYAPMDNMPQVTLCPKTLCPGGRHAPVDAMPQ